MGIFRKKAARVVRRSDAVEERIVSNVGNKPVTVRRFKEAPAKAEPEPPRSSPRSSGTGTSTKPSATGGFFSMDSFAS